MSGKKGFNYFIHDFWSCTRFVSKCRAVYSLSFRRMVWGGRSVVLPGVITYLPDFECTSLMSSVWSGLGGEPFSGECEYKPLFAETFNEGDWGVVAFKLDPLAITWTVQELVVLVVKLELLYVQVSLGVSVNEFQFVSLMLQVYIESLVGARVFSGQFQQHLVWPPYVPYVEGVAVSVAGNHVIV